MAAGAESFWAYLVHYAAGEPSGSAAAKKPLVDYRELLGEGDFALYLKLRDWRKER